MQTVCGLRKVHIASILHSFLHNHCTADEQKHKFLFENKLKVDLNC